MAKGLYGGTGVLESLEQRIAPATIIVTNVGDSEPGSLRAAIDQANASPGKDTIVFSKYFNVPRTITLTTGELHISDSVTIRGLGADQLTIDGNGSRIFTIDDLTDELIQAEIRGMTLTGANVELAMGSAIDSRESLVLKDSIISGNGGESPVNFSGPGRFTMNNVLVTGNFATEGVPSLKAYGTSISIRNSVIANNSGGIYVGGWSEMKSKVEVRDTLISQNDGMGLQVKASGSKNTILIADCNIRENSSVYTSGGIEILTGDGPGKVTLRDSVVSGNTSNNRAGITISAAFEPDMKFKITGLVCSNNVAEEFYGGMVVSMPEGNSLSITKSEFRGNSALAGDGGGLTIQRGEVKITNTTFDGNSAARDGGGLFAKTGTVTLSNSLFSENNAGRDGGGAFFDTNEPVSLQRNTFQNNSAIGTGGGLFASAAGVNVSKSEFLFNTASEGGGAMIDAAESRFISSIFSKNQAELSGGGIAATAGLLDLRNTRITENTAGESGGGIRTLGELSIRGSSVSGNLAPIDANISAGDQAS